MEIFNQEFIQEIIRLTWRNPAFMAIAIALVWLIPQLFIRKIMRLVYLAKNNKLKKMKKFLSNDNNRISFICKSPKLAFKETITNKNYKP